MKNELKRLNWNLVLKVLNQRAETPQNTRWERVTGDCAWVAWMCTTGFDISVQKTSWKMHVHVIHACAVQIPEDWAWNRGYAIIVKHFGGLQVSSAGRAIHQKGIRFTCLSKPNSQCIYALNSLNLYYTIKWHIHNSHFCQDSSCYTAQSE